MKPSYLQNIVNTIFARNYATLHVPYERKKPDPVDKKLSRYYRRAHGSKDAFISFEDLGIKQPQSCPSYYGKKNRHHYIPKRRKPPVGRSVLKAGPNHFLFMRLRRVCMDYVLQVPDVVIPEWDRIEFIVNHDRLTLQIYLGAAAPSYVHLTRAPKTMTLERLVENWKAFRFFDPYKQEMVSPLPRRLPARFSPTPANNQ